MPGQYNEAVATHYAAYRPPLHSLLLKRLIQPNVRFLSGLDIGCGTGYSTIALSEYCNRVVGIDPSKQMLDQVIPNPKVTYIHGVDNGLKNLPSSQFAVASFAGSLFYAKSDGLKTELLRTLTEDGVVLVYDFEIMLDELVTSTGISIESEKSDYNYEESLSDWPEFQTDIMGMDQLSLELSADEVSHVILADSNYSYAFTERYGTPEPFNRLTEHFQEIAQKHPVRANIYFSRFSLQNR